MTWGYKGQYKMGIELANAYTSLANEMNVLVIPAGLAFWVAEQKLPNIGLFVPDVLGSKNKGKAEKKINLHIKRKLLIQQQLINQLKIYSLDYLGSLNNGVGNCCFKYMFNYSYLYYI